MAYEYKPINPCFIWSQRAELNRRPTDYESVALPLSYAGLDLFRIEKMHFTRSIEYKSTA